MLSKLLNKVRKQLNEDVDWSLSENLTTDANNFNPFSDFSYPQLFFTQYYGSFLKSLSDEHYELPAPKLEKKYKPYIVDKIIIPFVHGLLCVRKFNLNEFSELKSTYKDYVYESEEVETEINSNEEGFYAYRLGTQLDYPINGFSVPLDLTLALVDMYGKVHEHSDGVVRATNLRLITLITNTSAHKIGQLYNVPIIQTYNPNEFIEQWIINEGYEWFKHNKQIGGLYGNECATNKGI